MDPHAEGLPEAVQFFRTVPQTGAHNSATAEQWQKAYAPGFVRLYLSDTCVVIVKLDYQYRIPLNVLDVFDFFTILIWFSKKSKKKKTFYLILHFGMNHRKSNARVHSAHKNYNVIETRHSVGIVINT